MRLTPLPVLAALVFLSACSTTPTQTGGDPLTAGLQPLTLDTTNWFGATHQLGRAPFRLENIEHGDGVKLHLPGDVSSAAEIRTRKWYGHGSYGAWIQCPDAPGSLCTFFLYEDVPGDANDEVDIEIFPGDERKVMYVVWVKGKQVHYVEESLPFDPREGLHFYRIDYQPDRITISIDGEVRATFTDNLPTGTMRLMSSAWWPNWMTPQPKGSTFLTLKSVWTNAEAIR